MRKLLELININVKDQNKYRLKHIKLELFSGEKVAVLGKSGSGKSTLIAVANGSIDPTNGVVKFKGEDLKLLPRERKIEIGTLWQDLRLIEELSVAQNINSGALGRHNLLWALRNLIGSIDMKACHTCIEAANLEQNLIHSQVMRLSGGQRQRVAIARLLRQQAEIILVDEPLSNLDPNMSRKILNILLKQTTVDCLHIADTCLVSLHRPELIDNFTRVIGIKKGQIVLDSPRESLEAKDLNWLYN
ncbi:ATP-binding cassette domain-containing protein [Prochlorococcus marinus]|uniref:Putative phosphonate ABC transporter n=1 Tax=Prochlorococcus marinus (strain MIT 9211) TaxID=93059 RepID=A9BA54_PROM4|nr:ATP-binding cassette domain-containing protein [Prochlorococcus marinus]ABX08716.1 Putative phosphonate ABC transporter [Prochlorococcus marinus str. MIT 9211]